eukprot:CAMPEP_0198109020 /NCGR_PEP_ID=MMETSP1442-20131203/1034_1 /TAXON_ID= /ORGANISM="Craspedostauros australis, Strain CCMP3328" /LENGTH=180 /DNA_ID=CAMNT_0043764485 /DNA_START=76 /DNA_END=618 /DNA_ORIENTATION=+
MSESYGAIKVEAGDAAPAGMNAGGIKQGHVCCGGCCDVRRATIIINVITLVFAVLSLFSAVSIKFYAGQAKSEVDDDEVKATLDDIQATPFGVAYFFIGIEIVFALAAIIGAVKYNSCLVLTVFIYYCVGAILNVVALDFIAVIISCLYAYPHYFLYKEIKSGIMSEENYVNEKQSCCCV